MPAGSWERAAVLYRNNPSAVGLIDLFDRKGLPFYIKDHKTTLRRQTLTQDVLCILNLYFSPWDLESFQRVYYKLGAYISRAMVQFAMDNPRTRDTIFDLLAEFPDAQIEAERCQMEDTPEGVLCTVTYQFCANIAAAQP